MKSQLVLLAEKLQNLLRTRHRIRKVDYYIEPFSKSLLSTLIKKMSMTPSELLRKNDAAYKKLKSKIEKLREYEILDLMIKNPDLIQRPIIELGN